MQIDDFDTRYSSWWCSNGLYKKVTAANTVTLNSQQIIGNAVNKRQELAMVGCPQKTIMCGTDTSNSIVTALVANTSAVVITVTSTLTTSDKCTWVG